MIQDRDVPPASSAVSTPASDSALDSAIGSIRSSSVRTVRPVVGPASTERDGPRERLRTNGVAALSDGELVALILRTGGSAGDALAVARKLLARCGGLPRLGRASLHELCRTAGVGPAKSASLIAATELARRTNAQPLQLGDRFSSPAQVHDHFRGRLRDALQESFFAVLLDGRHRVITEVTVSRGTLTASLVHPREVFCAAIREAAAAIVLVHNHPSGDPSPSAEDHEVTRRLVRAGEILGVRVVDHVIVATSGYYSFAEAGELGDRARAASGLDARSSSRAPR